MLCSFTPQMSPMFWLLLQTYFIFLLMMLIMCIYFFLSNTFNKMCMYTSKKTFNWLW